MDKVMNLVKWPFGVADEVKRAYAWAAIVVLFAAALAVPAWAFWGAVALAAATVLPYVLAFVSDNVKLLGWLDNELTKLPTEVVEKLELVGFSTVLALGALAFGFGGWVGWVLAGAALLFWAPFRTRAAKLPFVGWAFA